MSHHIYKTIEVTGTSGESFEKAIEAAIARSAQTVNNLRWFEVIDTRGAIDGGSVKEWQATVKIGFTLEG